MIKESELSLFIRENFMENENTVLDMVRLMSFFDCVFYSVHETQRARKIIHRQRQLKLFLSMDINIHGIDLYKSKSDEMLETLISLYICRLDRISLTRPFIQNIFDFSEMKNLENGVLPNFEKLDSLQNTLRKLKTALLKTYFGGLTRPEPHYLELMGVPHLFSQASDRTYFKRMDDFPKWILCLEEVKYAQKLGIKPYRPLPVTLYSVGDHPLKFKDDDHLISDNLLKIYSKPKGYNETFIRSLFQFNLAKLNLIPTSTKRRNIFKAVDYYHYCCKQKAIFDCEDPNQTSVEQKLLTHGREELTKYFSDQKLLNTFYDHFSSLNITEDILMFLFALLLTLKFSPKLFKDVYTVKASKFEKHWLQFSSNKDILSELGLGVEITDLPLKLAYNKLFFLYELGKADYIKHHKAFYKILRQISIK